LGIADRTNNALACISNKWPVVTGGYPFSPQETVESTTSVGVIINSLAVLDRGSVVATQWSESPSVSIFPILSFKFSCTSEFWAIEEIVVTETTLRYGRIGSCTSSYRYVKIVENV
jgi:hypothetical protein